MVSLLRRGVSAVRERLKRPAPNFKLYRRAVSGKAGLEIGGPSEAFRARDVLPLYTHLLALDNCDFSANTVWAQHSPEFLYLPGKPAGKTIFCDGSELTPVAAASYDFVFSSHNLEHFANPVKALYEWKRVLRPGGALVLVLPDYRRTFDHRRTPTPAADMMQDYANAVGEDDLSHLAEILELHDLSLDPAAGDRDHFERRSQKNFENRCLHHHVFDEHNSRELLTLCGFNVLAADRVAPIHICLLARRKEG